MGGWDFQSSEATDPDVDSHWNSQWTSQFSSSSPQPSQTNSDQSEDTTGGGNLICNSNRDKSLRTNMKCAVPYEADLEPFYFKDRNSKGRGRGNLCAGGLGTARLQIFAKAA